METRYLESDYGVEAVGRIMAGGVLLGVGKREKVGWRDTWEKTELGGRSLLATVLTELMFQAVFLEEDFVSMCLQTAA